MSATEIIFAIYVSIGCIYWLWLAVGSWITIRRTTILKDIDVDESPSWPRLSVVIPACDEGHTLWNAIQTVLAQDYPDIEIVLINDRSTDNTGQIVNNAAATDKRVKPVHITELPDGWLGKVNALSHGFERTSGQWVLFTDADVHLAPGTLRRAVAYAENRRLDHLALIPDAWPSTLLTDIAISAFFRIFLVSMRAWAVENPKSSAYAGVGAFNLVRRETFEKTDGFEWLRLEVADDVGLGLMMKCSGAHSAVAHGRDLVGLHWYNSVAEMARGAEKGYSSLGHCNPLRLVGMISLLSFLELSPFIAVLLCGMPQLQVAGAMTMLVGISTIIAMHRWARRPIFPGLLVPVAAMLNLAFSFRAAWLGFRRGGVVWRGTLYPSRVLREGVRVKLWQGASETLK
ncbi:MAG: glycosyltransferase [Pirellulales bacterium]|nr:glycosyltransferase [Pirellulales bacterium]